MNWIYFELSIVKLKDSQARAVILCASVILAACSQTTKTAENVADNHGPAQSTAAFVSPTPSSSQTPEIEQLKMPERVASGAVTESGGAWNKAVQRINYVTAADNTRQPMMFYKPQVYAPRPLLVALHSWSNNYRQKESVIYGRKREDLAQNCALDHVRSPCAPAE